MQIQIGEGDEQRQQAVIRLFDKALRNMPDNHEIAETAAWDMYMRYRDMDEALRYVEIAVAIPGAPHRLKRVYAVWRDRSGEWSFEDALKYWQEAREEAETKYDVSICDRQIYRLFAARDEEQLNPLLDDWVARTGRCPDQWDPVIDAGWLREVPVDYFGSPYRILPESCEAMGEQSVRFD
jgi:tetratricopeptide (TPR) repeat protein